MPSGGVIVTEVGIRNSSRGACAFTAQRGAIVASIAACVGPVVRRARTTSSAAVATHAPTPTATTARIAGRIISTLSAQLQELSGTGGGRAQMRVVERQRHRFDDLEPVARQADETERAVGEPADLSDADVAEDLRADPELAKVLQPRGERGARGAGAVTLAGGEEVEPAAVAPEIEDHALPLGSDSLHRLLEEAPRVALAIPEDVPRQVLEVRAHEGRLVGADVALHEHQVLGIVDVGRVDERPEVATVSGRDARLGAPMHERIVAAPILDQLRDGGDFQIVTGGELLEGRKGGHRAG